jgi:hypothetical protein
MDWKIWFLSAMYIATVELIVILISSVIPAFYRSLFCLQRSGFEMESFKKMQVLNCDIWQNKE